jgi:hypothetical protein
MINAIKNLLKLKTKIGAEELAKDMFNLLVIDEMNDFFQEEVKHWQSSDSFDEQAFNRILFIYLASYIGVALSVRANKVHSFEKVIYYFRQYVRKEAKLRFGTSDAELDKAIENGSDELIKLLFTEPKTAPALDFEWSIAWLKRFGVEESNPIQLSKIAFKWKNSFLHLLNMLNTMKVA